ncbi:TlpA family protein disulfide reductase [Olivibacter sp. SDN3]|nr:TlpA family protein disulfide reductase [Olivibacter sp. SDN3]
MPSVLFVLQEYLGDSVKISLPKRHNPFLNEEIKLVYPTDSLMSWTSENVPEGAIPETSVNFPFCVHDEIVNEQVVLYLIPLKNPVVTWNDDRLNHIPTLSVMLATNKTANFLGAEIYVVQLKYDHHRSPLSIEIKENGQFHRDRINEGLAYKHSYRLQDTVNIEGKPYRLDSLDTGMENLYLHPVVETGAAYIPDVHLAKLLPYFSENNEYLVLDFWGTWCAPCIEALPHLQELYSSSKEEYDFLSICFDRPENFDKAKEIFSEHGVAWPQLLDNQQARKSTISRGLNVSNFPTYMIIDRTGEILYSNYGTEGFEGLKKFMVSE